MRITKTDLVRLHETLNKGLFNGSLSKAYVPQVGTEYSDGVEIGFKCLDDKKYLACFESTSINKKEIIAKAIYFDFDFISSISLFDDELMKTGIIASVMLHEMIHQHLTEVNKRPSLGITHNTKFFNDGCSHGYYYLLGALIEDGRIETPPKQAFRHKYYDLLPAAEAVIHDFRFTA